MQLSGQWIKIFKLIFFRNTTIQAFYLSHLDSLGIILTTLDTVPGRFHGKSDTSGIRGQFLSFVCYCDMT